MLGRTWCRRSAAQVRRKKVVILQCRTRSQEHKEFAAPKRLTLGRYGDMTPEQARQMAARLTLEVRPEAIRASRSTHLVNRPSQIWQLAFWRSICRARSARLAPLPSLTTRSSSACTSFPHLGSARWVWSRACLSDATGCRKRRAAPSRARLMRVSLSGRWLWTASAETSKGLGGSCSFLAGGSCFSNYSPGFG